MALQECDECKKEIMIYANEDTVCPHCGKKYPKSTSKQQAQGAKKIKDLQKVKLRDESKNNENKEVWLTRINIPFLDMVELMIKWGFASIPVAIIWLVLGYGAFNLYMQFIK